MNAIPRHPTFQRAYEGWLKLMREEHRLCGGEERFFKGYIAIAEEMNRIGCRTGTRQPVTPHTIYTWRVRRGFPMWVNNKKDGAITSNLMIQAWMAAYIEYKKMKPKYRFPKIKDRPPKATHAQAE